LRCHACGLGYVDQPPTTAAQEQAYSEEYFVGSRGYADYEKEKAALQSNFKRRIRDLRQFSAGGSLFEVGCAYGFFLELAGQHWLASGIDVSAAAASHARNRLNLNVSQAGVENHQVAPASHDVIVMWDAIEHLRDPFLAVEKIATALRPGGILALTTGDLDAVLPRIQRTRWRLFHPLHLYYFSLRSMTRLLNKHGLKVVRSSHEGNDRSVRQMAQVFGNRVARKIERLPFADRCFRVNLHDIMFVIAQKTLEEATCTR
jgi:2-polyprenyl-3-methyl-5-hydroxy-6-metoxy-1,4-benzoquinol methylase